MIFPLRQGVNSVLFAGGEGRGGEGGFEPPTKFSKKGGGGGGLTGYQFLEGGRGERRGDLFQGGVRAFT